MQPAFMSMYCKHVDLVIAALNFAVYVGQCKDTWRGVSCEVSHSHKLAWPCERSNAGADTNKSSQSSRPTGCNDSKSRSAGWKKPVLQIRYGLEDSQSCLLVADTERLERAPFISSMGPKLSLAAHKINTACPHSIQRECSLQCSMDARCTRFRHVTANAFELLHKTREEYRPYACVLDHRLHRMVLNGLRRCAAAGAALLNAGQAGGAQVLACGLSDSDTVFKKWL